MTVLLQIVTDRCELSNCLILIFQFSGSVTLTNESRSFAELPVSHVHCRSVESWKPHECGNMPSFIPLTHTNCYCFFFFFSIADCGFAEQEHQERHSELLWWPGLQKHHGLCTEEGELLSLFSVIWQDWMVQMSFSNMYCKTKHLFNTTGLESGFEVILDYHSKLRGMHSRTEK